jgi:hypothetical protein
VLDDSRVATVTPIVAPRPRPVTLGGIHHDVDEMTMTVVHHSHRPVPFGARRTAGEMTAGRHRRLHLARAGTTIGVMIMTAGVGMAAETVGSPRGGIVGAATRSRGLRRLVEDATSVPRLVERAHETGIGTVLVLVITNAEEMIHGTDTGIAGGNESSRFFGCIYLSRLCCVLLSDISIPAFIKTMLHRRALVGRMHIQDTFRRFIPYHLAMGSAVDHSRAFHGTWHHL